MIRTAIFASGNGSNFEAIVNASRRGELNTEIALCVCDKPGAGVIERSRRLNVPIIVANPKEFPDKASYERFLVNKLLELDIFLISLAGYMRLVGPTLLEAFPNRIINIHPSLLPAFKGAHAIKDAFDYGVKVFGVTVHFVDETLDGGKIISQEAIHYDGGNIHELEMQIHKIEHQLYPKTINHVISLFTK